MTSYTHSPEEYGAALRALREAVQPRLSGTALAARLGWPQSKVSRIETGRQLPTTSDVTAWCQAVDADPTTRDRLLADLADVAEQYASLRQQLRHGLPAKQQAWAELERTSARIRVFEPVIVPGLLQTPDYARHRLGEATRRSGASDADVATAVLDRMRRQDILYTGGGPLIQMLITEATLRYRLAPPEVMRGQLDRLHTATGLDTVQLRVIPFDRLLPTAPLHGFWIFDDRLVQAEHYTDELVLRSTEQIEAYQAIFDELWDFGLAGPPAAALITRAIND